jgi:cytochrome c oxidase assembly protein subunit 11
MSGRRHLRTLVPLVGVVAGMAGMAWAAVPLYDMFCRVTGFGGTPLVAEQGADRVLDRTVTVRFDASTAAGMPWEFTPEETARTIRIGETALAFYDATNPTDRPITGTATFNVTPPIVGGYFVKIDCFCFEEQTLMPGEAVQMPVTFYVDPAIVDDPEARAVGTITLSYTFFEKPAEQAALDATRAADGG